MSTDRRRKADSPLRNIRRSRAISQEQLADLVGVTQETISKAERGVIGLTADVQTRIATVLGSSRSELFPEAVSA